MELNFRPLRADEIEIRVGTVTANGASLLLYKDARVDMTLLDEVVGPLNWKREHSRDNANCTVSIWDEDKKTWVSKEDVGTQSNTEAQKGLASDSFKRACVNWGVGRELYSSPFIWISCPTKQRQDGRYELADRNQFSGAYVKEIAYDDRGNVVNLTICDKNGTPIFSQNEYVPAPANNEEADRKELLKEIRKLCEVKEITEEYVCKKGEVDDIEDMETPRLENLLKWLAGA